MFALFAGLNTLSLSLTVAISFGHCICRLPASKKTEHHPGGPQIAFTLRQG
jgi:hypothetical protein